MHQLISEREKVKVKMEFVCSPAPMWILWVVGLSLKNMQVQLTQNDMSMWVCSLPCGGLAARPEWISASVPTLLIQAPLLSNARGYNHS